MSSEFNSFDEKKQFMIFLSMFDLSITKLEQIIKTMGNDFSFSHFLRINFPSTIINTEQLSQMKERANLLTVKSYYNNLIEQNIVLISKFDEKFPKKLQNLPDCPIFLFCKGDISLLSCPSIGIVGSRKPTNYGRIITDKFAGELAKNGLVIVSGLAYGVDSIAHKKCLEENGKTIAVLGSGINEIYPAVHTALADEIAEKGLLISEYPMNQKATKYSFPQRNRIIAGLSDGVLITQASIKSGTIHTKDFALDYGKNIYVVPGNIEVELSELPNEIIKTGQGQCVTCVDDILRDYNLNNQETNMNKTYYQLSIEEENIVNLLYNGMKNIDELIEKSGLNINIFNSYLTTLEIRGIIKRLPGGMIALN